MGFIGLWAGTEVAIAQNFPNPKIKDASQVIFSDTLKAFVGLGVSIIITFGRPILEKMISK